MKGALAKEGIVLAEGMVVVLRGTIDLYRPKGEIGFILSELDVTALLGRLAAQRAQLLAEARGRGVCCVAMLRSPSPRCRFGWGWWPVPGPRAIRTSSVS